MQKLVLTIVCAVVLSACTTYKNLVSTLESPLVVGTVAVASQAECQAQAEKNCSEAAIAKRVMDGVIPQLTACRDGLEAGLMSAACADSAAAEVPGGTRLLHEFPGQ